MGLPVCEDPIDFRKITRFYPDSKTIFHKHLAGYSDKYKAFVLENARGQRIFVLASDADASNDRDY